MSKSNRKKSAAAEAEALPRTVEQIEAEIAKQREIADRGFSWTNRDKHTKAELAIVDLTAELELAKLRSLPAPASVETKFQERSISIATIRITGNHREHHDPAALERLANSLRTQTLQQRIGVRAVGDGGFELIFGSRRLAAAKLAGWDEIPAKVYDSSLTPAQVEILRSIENLGRKNLTPIEEAVAIARTIDAIESMLDAMGKEEKGFPIWMNPRGPFKADDFTRGFDEYWKKSPAKLAAYHLAQAIFAAGGLEEYVGQQYSRDAKWIKDHAYISKLGGKSRELLMTGRIDIGHARELAKLGDRDAAESIAERVCRNEQGLGGVDVARTRQFVHDSLRSLRTVPWRLDVAFGKDVKGCTGYACTTCPFNSKADPDLFGGSIADEPAAGVCTNGACFAAKTDIVDREMDRTAKKAEPVVKKIVAAATKDQVDGEDLPNPVTKTTVGHLLPSMVKPDSGVRRLQKDLAALIPQKETNKPTVSASRKGESQKRTPEQLAESNFRQAREEWRKQLIEKVVELTGADTTGNRLLAILCLDVSELAGALEDAWQDPKAAAEAMKDHEQDLEDAVDANITSLQTMAKRLGKSNHFFDSRVQLLSYGGSDRCTPLYARLCDGWGGQAPPEPKLEDFLPKPKAVKPITSKEKSPKKSKQPAALAGAAS